MNRILVIALAGIGDTLMATPLLHELRLNFPEARLEMLTMWPGAAALLEGNPHLDALHQHHFLKASRWASLRFALGLRRPRFDVSINAHPQGRQGYRIIARLIGARRRLSHTYENAGWLDRHLVTDTLPQDYSVHAAENNARFLPLIGARRQLPRLAYEIYLSANETTWASGYLEKQGLAGVPWLGVHAGSGGTKNLALRRWPLGHYVELVARLGTQFPELPVLFFSGPEDRVAQSELFTRLRGGRVYFPECPTIRHAAALVERAHSFLSVDTAFMHLAAAMQVPHQFVIETPTLNPCIMPLRDDWVRIPNPAVAGRHLDFYRYDGRPIAGTPEEIRRIMEGVSVDAVAEALSGVLPGSR
ncbi:MAG: glycosyltransferase family 9 protein [Verrucomicrobia bacterium]|nr:glycosyltransferase family 9 protein [Verrucomicrobiota bacterium]